MQPRNNFMWNYKIAMATFRAKMALQVHVMDEFNKSKWRWSDMEMRNYRAKSKK